ncbi:MAG TPA: hypothetical protein VFE84_06530, partial [Patescibacteria group bacterium]|nr:hypothetical protein [Patescibacteria group bacterium]
MPPESGEKSGTPGAALQAGMARRARRLASRLQDSAERLLGRNLFWAVFFVAILAPVVSQQECS